MRHLGVGCPRARLFVLQLILPYLTYVPNHIHKLAYSTYIFQN